jgi:hypothetical protein
MIESRKAVRRSQRWPVRTERLDDQLLFDRKRLGAFLRPDCRLAGDSRIDDCRDDRHQYENLALIGDSRYSPSMDEHARTIRNDAAMTTMMMRLPDGRFAHAK